MRTRRLIGLAVSVATTGLAILPVASPVWADGDGYVDPDGNPTVEAGEPGTDGTGEPGDDGDGDGPECWFEVVVADDFTIKVFNQWGERQYSETGRWLMQVCEDIGPVAYNGMPVFPEGGFVDPGELAEQARESVPIAAPAAVTSPAAGRLVVQMATWLWVNGAWWHEYSATATAGRVSATIVATPLRAVWSTGDGATVDCMGPGTPWQRGVHASTDTCAYTYRTTSPPSGFDLSVIVEFDVSWSSNVGQSGTLDTITRTTTQTVHVGEVQAIGTG